MSYYSSGYNPKELQILPGDYSGDGALLLSLFRSNLVDSGWTLLRTHGGFLLFSITGVPADGGTLTPDSSESEVYTWKTAINNSNPREVLIGADAFECMENMIHAINDDGAGKGTLYSTATSAAHPSVVAGHGYELDHDNVNLFIMRTASSLDTFTGTEAATNVSRDFSPSRYNGAVLQSAVAPAGHRTVLLLYLDSNYVKFEGWPYLDPFQTINGSLTVIKNNGATRVLNACYFGAISYTAGYSLLIKSTPLWISIFSPNYYSAYSSLLMQVPKISPGTEPLQIITATNASPIVIETAVPHGWETAEQISVEWGLGNTAMNGDWTATKVDDYRLSLDGSAGNGDYEGAGYVGGPDRVVRFVVGGDRRTWRNANGSVDANAASIVNQWYANAYDSNQWILGEFPDGVEGRQFLGAVNMIIPPEIRVPHGTAGAANRWTGFFWDSFLVNHEHTRDIVIEAGGKLWKSFGAGTDFSFWIMEEGSE
jgi:hypothetical protein